MAITAISPSVSSASAAAASTTGSSSGGGFVDLLFGQLAAGLVGAGTPLSTEIAEDAKPSDTPTGEEAIDPALAFLLGNPALQAQVPANPQNTANDEETQGDRRPPELLVAGQNDATATASAPTDALPLVPGLPAQKSDTPKPAAAKNENASDPASALAAGTPQANTGSLLQARTSAPTNQSAAVTATDLQTRPGNNGMATDLPQATANIAGETPAAAAAPQFSSQLASSLADSGKTTTRTEIQTPLHASNWNQDFANKVVWLAKGEQQQAQININPPQLGPIQITLHLNGDQASAVFASPHAEVRQAIESSLPQLREMLSASGVNLGQTDVGANLAQQNRETPFQTPNGTRSSGENAILPGSESAGKESSPSPLQRGRGLVDLFA